MNATTTHRPNRALCRYLCAVLIGLLVPGPAAIAAERDNSTLLAKVKTAYLFNIAKFVHWPQATAEVNLCIDPRSLLAPYVQKLDQRDIGGSRRLRVFSIDRTGEDCQIYYSENPEAIGQEPLVGVSGFAGSADSKLTQLLLISDHPDSLARGYGMQLQVEGSRLRFRYSPEFLAKSDFQVSSKLLALAMR